MSSDSTHWARPPTVRPKTAQLNIEATERCVAVSYVQGQQPMNGNLRFAIEVKGIGARPQSSSEIAREFLGILQNALDAGDGHYSGFFDVEVGLFELGRE